MANGTRGVLVGSRRLWRSGTSLVLAVALSGCTMTVPEMKVRETASYASTANSGGLVVAVHPTVDPTELDAVFRINMVDQGVLPVLLVAENQSSTASFVLATENIRLAERGSNQTGARPRVSSEGPGVGLTTAGAFAPLVPVLLPLLIVGVKMVSDAQVIEHNVADKAFYSRTLDPGQKAFGYLYMPLPKQGPGAYEVTVRALDAGGGPDTVIVIPVDHKAH